MDYLNEREVAAVLRLLRSTHTAIYEAEWSHLHMAKRGKWPFSQEKYRITLQKVLIRCRIAKMKQMAERNPEYAQRS